MILLLFTTLLWGSAPIIEKIALGRVEPLIGVTIRSIAITAIMVFVIVGTGRWEEMVRVDKKTVLLLTVGGICGGFLGLWAYFEALKIGATSKVVAIAATYPLITSLLSVIILKEAVTLPKLIGTLLIIAGICLVK